jgi:hypothetical protein
MPGTIVSHIVSFDSKIKIKLKKKKPLGSIRAPNLANVTCQDRDTTWVPLRSSNFFTWTSAPKPSRNLHLCPWHWCWRSLCALQLTGSSWPLDGCAHSLCGWVQYVCEHHAPTSLLSKDTVSSSLGPSRAPPTANVPYCTFLSDRWRDSSDRHHSLFPNPTVQSLRPCFPWENKWRYQRPWDPKSRTLP